VQLRIGETYRIKLCSGQVSCWRYLGPDGRGDPRWRDAETGREFCETSLLYAWEILGTQPGAAPTA